MSKWVVSKLVLWVVLMVAVSITSTRGQRSYSIDAGGESEVKSIYTDTLAFSLAVSELVTQLRADQYLLAGVDSVVVHDSVVTAYVYKGQKYAYRNIRVKPSDQVIVNGAGLRKYRWSRNMISAQQVESYMEDLLDFLDNNGYPFAKVGLDSVVIDEGQVDASIVIDRGASVTFDSLVLSGNVEISEQYLRKYLQIDQGAAFSKKKYEQIAKRMRELPFLELVGEPTLRFYGKKAHIYMEAKKKNSNRFDFLIGILPSTEAGQSKLTVTGEFTAELQNKLGAGEYIYASFERLRPEVQELEVRFSYPYIGGLPIGVQSGLEVYRRSGDFIEVDAEVGLDYQLNGFSNLQISWLLGSSRLIDIDSSAILQSKRLPANLDISNKGGKIAFSYTDLDYKWNPAVGWDIKLATTLGQKSILPNPTIQSLSVDDVDFASSYDTLQLNTLQVRSDLSVTYFMPLAPSITVKTELRSGYILNEEKVYENEYYRIGGNRLLRGFDEQSVLAQGYGLLTVEARLLLDLNSYLTLPFIDVGYTQVKDGDGNLAWDRVLGLGLGINFSTPAGLFNVSFASGSRLGIGLDFANPKVHFGYVSLF